MPVYIAVRCFQCQMFQVIQKPKSNKFKCPVCNNKQSVRKIYCTSDKAKDCRIVVQQYNKIYGEMVQEAQNIAFQENVSDTNNDNCMNNIFQDGSSNNVVGHSEYYCTNNVEDCYDNDELRAKKKSQWEEYLSEDDQDDHDTNKSNGNAEVKDKDRFVFEIGKSLRRKNTNKRKKKDIEGSNRNNNNNNSIHDNASTNVKKRQKVERKQANNSSETNKFTKRKSSNSSILDFSSTTNANTQNIYFASNHLDMTEHKTNNTIATTAKTKSGKSQWDDFISDDESSQSEW
jgi:hypothetical protein